MLAFALSSASAATEVSIKLAPSAVVATSLARVDVVIAFNALVIIWSSPLSANAFTRFNSMRGILGFRVRRLPSFLGGEVVT